MFEVWVSLQKTVVFQPNIDMNEMTRTAVFHELLHNFDFVLTEIYCHCHKYDEIILPME